MRVAVLVDLIWSPKAGGHVKCWEKIAAAATRRDDLELVVHFSGDEERVVTLSESVCFQIHRPVFSTEKLSFLGHIPDHTDLSPHHPGLARALTDVDVIHTTDAFFAFADTAVRLARRRSIPLVNSVHTDTPIYTRVFTGQIVRRFFGEGAGSRLLLDRLSVDQRMEMRMLRKLRRHQALSAHTWVANEEERRRLLEDLPNARCHLLRRGIDLDFFSPRHRDREWLEHEYGVAKDAFVVLFVGRLDRVKRVIPLADAIRLLMDVGSPVHLFCAGRGPDGAYVQERLGAAVTAPGFVEPETMSRIYASADLFAMPSEVEVFANVVPEAMASGLAAVVSSSSGMGQLVKNGETGHIVQGTEPAAWADVMAPLIRDPARTAQMGQAARKRAEAVLPSWDDILADELMPYWRQAVREGAGNPA